MILISIRLEIVKLVVAGLLWQLWFYCSWEYTVWCHRGTTYWNLPGGWPSSLIQVTLNKVKLFCYEGMFLGFMICYNNSCFLPLCYEGMFLDWDVTSAKSHLICFVLVTMTWLFFSNQRWCLQSVLEFLSLWFFLTGC